MPLSTSGGQNLEAGPGGSPVYAFEPEPDDEDVPSPNTIIESDLLPVDVSFVDNPGEHHSKHHKKEMHINRNDKPYAEIARMENEPDSALHQLETAQIVVEDMAAGAKTQAERNVHLDDDHYDTESSDYHDEHDGVLDRPSEDAAMNAVDPGDVTAPVVPPRETEGQEDSDPESQTDSENEAEETEDQVAAGSPGVSPAESKDGREFYVAKLSCVGSQDQCGIHLSQMKDKHVVQAVTGPKAAQQGIATQDELVEINVRPPPCFPPYSVAALCGTCSISQPPLIDARADQYGLGSTNVYKCRRELR